MKVDDGAARFCVSQYNKVLARLMEIEPAVQGLFTPLPENASAEIVRLASHELSAFFEDERPERHRGFRRARRGCRPGVIVARVPRGWHC
jgi:hypothetical protein